MLTEYKYPTGESSHKKTQLLVAGSMRGLSMFATLPAFAQASDTTAHAPKEKAREAGEAAADESILVTNSRIRRPNFE